MRPCRRDEREGATTNESTRASWQQARKEPFEAFGILYYPLFRSRADLPTELDDADMAWAVTANANLDGTGYTLSQASILVLASFHRAMADLAEDSTFLPLAAASIDAINPLDDIQRLVPDVTAKPMYPDFPQQVMEISEAQFRYDQACHYFSTYGVEALAGLLGLDVTVGKGWMPKVEATEKTREDETLVAPKVLHVLVTLEDLQAAVAARFMRATRMHPAEISTALIAFGEQGALPEAGSFPRVAFHENMMKIIYVASLRDSATLERVATGFAQHPGDLLKATLYLLKTGRKTHLATRQKKGLCRAFEHFSVRAIARNLADAGKEYRLACNYLSVARFGGPNLREALELVDTDQVRAWASEIESLWEELEIIGGTRRLKGPLGTFEGSEEIERAWSKLIAHYGLRPGMLFRSLGRLIKSHCPSELLSREILRHADSYSIPSIVRALVTMSEYGDVWRLMYSGYAVFYVVKESPDENACNLRRQLLPIMREVLALRLRSFETPLKGKRIYLDTAGVSLKGSMIVPNETGNTGTAWPPVGMAFDLPVDKTVRFFTFWDDRTKRVDVDLHFVGVNLEGERVSIGWNTEFGQDGLVTSGDIVTSHNSVEYLDANMAEARKSLHFVIQEQHIFSGAKRWGSIETCYTGAAVVSDTSRDVRHINRKNLLFRDDLTGEGTRLAYAVVNFPDHYVRILRGTDLPIGDASFSLGDYLEALFEAQGVTLVDDPEEAEVCVCVGRSEDPRVISLFDEGFFVG